MKYIKLLLSFYILTPCQLSFSQLEDYHWNHQLHPQLKSKWVESMEVMITSKNISRKENITYYPSGRIFEIVFEAELGNIDSVFLYREFIKTIEENKLNTFGNEKLAEILEMNKSDNIEANI